MSLAMLPKPHKECSTQWTKYIFSPSQMSSRLNIGVTSLKASLSQQQLIWKRSEQCREKLIRWNMVRCDRWKYVHDIILRCVTKDNFLLGNCVWPFVEREVFHFTHLALPLAWPSSCLPHNFLFGFLCQMPKTLLNYFHVESLRWNI